MTLRASSPYTIQDINFSGVVKEIDSCRILNMVSHKTLHMTLYKGKLQRRNAIAFPNASTKWVFSLILRDLVSKNLTNFKNLGNNGTFCKKLAPAIVGRSCTTHPNCTAHVKYIRLISNLQNRLADKKMLSTETVLTGY